MPPDRYEILAGTKVPRRDIEGYFTPEFAELLSAWSMTKRWKMMPFAGGWAEQPCRLMDVMNEFDTLYTEWEQDDKRRT